MSLFEKKILAFFIIATCVVFFGCNDSKKKTDHPMFEALDSKRTGLNFSNDLHYDKELNLFKYLYFYNGSGVAAGDFNNDGKIDLFFGSNQKQNTLYLNNGNLNFKEVTKEAGIVDDGAWTTGISVIDINNDGLLDIYVCRVGNYRTLHSKNQLLINQGNDKNGIPIFIDKAAEYGLDFSGFSTQAVFFDYDMDGDLDMFLLNHTVRENGTYRPRHDFDTITMPLTGDRIYQNNNGKFKDVTKQTGIQSSPLGYGLGVVVADINLDGYPDIYVGNDFHENDYLYINQKNGTFKEVGTEQMMHTSQFSMGVDVADINNDAFPEIISMDMLPEDPYILKRSLGEDTYDIFNFKINSGYSYQYTRNNLQYNRGNGMFSEIGLYSGVAATDWSWAPLWVDFNNDGLKDLFISNGIPKRMNDIDYINFVSDGEIQRKISENNMEDNDLSLINKFPEIKLPNKFYLNKGDLKFSDESLNITNNLPSFSNGALYADLDNDGDLDIVVNNINAPATLYENRVSSDSNTSSIAIKLTGTKQNIHAIGSKIIVYAGRDVRTYEKYPVRGFLSSMETDLLIGTGGKQIDSMLVVWPNNTFEQIKNYKYNKKISIQFAPGLPVFDYSRLTNRSVNPTKKVTDITTQVGMDFLHEENKFGEFDREPLIPHLLSTEGPAIAVADINHDGLDDIFLGASRDKKSAVFIQQSSGKFKRLVEPSLDADSSYENIEATWIDVNNDGNKDLVIASGGNEFYGPDAHNTPRIYLNDNKGNLTKLENAFGDLFLTASCIAPIDINGDGFVDLFIGGRVVPWEYGQIPQSYLLLNDGHGHFKDVTEQYAPALKRVGFVTSAQWFDINKDGKKDLLISLEWGGVIAFVNTNNVFKKVVLSDKKGWWNFILPVDLNNDGYIDLICGNLGLNSRLKASVKEPVKLYYNDFDNNGKKEQVLTYYLAGKEIPFANKAELEKQLPVIKKKFLFAGDFAKASLSELFGSDKLDNAEQLSADYFSSAVLMNKGNMTFETIALPWEAQLSPLKDAVVVNTNEKSFPEVLLMGNFYANNIEMGRNDADFGTILSSNGKGGFELHSLNGLAVKGQIRHIKPISINKRPAFVLAKNNDSARIIQFHP